MDWAWREINRLSLVVFWIEMSRLNSDKTACVAHVDCQWHH